jgi:hypothetical protein
MPTFMIFSLASGNVYNGLGKLVGVAGALVACFSGHAWKMAAFVDRFNPSQDRHNSN